MLGPASKPINFPMHLLPYTDTLFAISGVLQIFWCIPIIKRWGINWYYIGLIGTIGLCLLLLMTRIPNGITNLPLEDKNPMALLTEITQFLFIGVTIIIIKFEYAERKLYRTNHENQWFNERFHIIEEVIEDKTSRSYNNNYDTDVRNAQSLNDKGVRLRKLGLDKEAIEHFEESLKICPIYSKALYNKGVCLNRIGKKEEALEVYDKAKYISTNNRHKSKREYEE